MTDNQGLREESLPLIEPQPRKRSTLLTVCPFILGNEFCERLAYYGLATNLVMYITNIMGGDPASAAIQVSLFEGTCYITPLLGAYLADSKWGRYKTIWVFSSIYLLGMIMLALTSYLPGFTPLPDQQANSFQTIALVASLSVVAIGTGGIKPNVSAFGADQFNEADPEDRREKESFFNWFYLAINVGSLLACTVVVFIQDQLSWTLGFAVPAVAMFLAIVLFLMGRKVYKHIKPTESPMERVIRVVWAALQNRWTKRHTPRQPVETVPQDALSSLRGASHWPTSNTVHVGSAVNGGGLGGVGPSSLYGGGVGDINRNGNNNRNNSNSNNNNNTTGNSNGFFFFFNSNSNSNPSDRSTKGGDVSVSGRYISALAVPLAPVANYRWLEDAITDWQTSQGLRMHASGLAGHYTPQQVEEVKMVLRLMPIFFTTMLYWTIYTQMGSFFVQQGNLMDRTLHRNGDSFRIPSASMSLFNTLSIIVLIPVYDKLVEPLIARFWTKITLLQRIGWGMLLSVLSMWSAALVERWRLNLVQGCRIQEIPLSDPQCNLNIFWQAPQYLIVGASEVLASIGQLEFFYDQAPDVMRSCSMALQLLSTAIGSYLSGGLVWLVQASSPALAGRQWLPRDLNDGRLDLFFYFLAIIMVANMFVYVVVAVNYTYKAVEHRRVIPPHVRAQDEIMEGAVVVFPGGGGGVGSSATTPGESLVGVAAAAALQQQDQQQQQQTASAVPRRAAAAAAAMTTRIGSSALAVPGGGRTAAKPVGIRGGGRRGRHGHVAASPDVDLYGRSLAYIPPSPALPAPFR